MFIEVQNYEKSSKSGMKCIELRKLKFYLKIVIKCVYLINLYKNEW